MWRSRPSRPPYDLTAESRAKLAGEVTVTMFKLLPRLAVLDWGDYEKGTGTNFNNGTPRSFSFGLALEEEGDNLRNYTSKTTDWLPSASMFFAHNRFAFANLKPGTTYWFWIIAHELGPKKEDSDKTWFSFTTPEENLAPNVILYKDFDDFWFRGCPIYQAFGPRSLERPDRREHRPRRPELRGSLQQNPEPLQYHRLVLQLREQCDRQPRSGQSGQTVGLLVGRRHLRHGLRRRRLPRLAGLLGPLPDRSRTALDRIRLGLHQDPPKLAGIGEGTADITVTCHTAPYFEPYHSWGQDHEQHYIQVEGPGTITDGGPTKTEPTGAATANTDKQVTVQCTTHVDSNKVPHNRLRKSHGARDQDHRSHQGDPHRDRRPPVRDQTLPAVDRRHQGNERLTTANNL